MSTLEFATAFFLSLAISQNAHHLASVASFFMKESNTRKIQTKSEFRNGRRHVSFNCTEPFHKLKASVLLLCLSEQCDIGCAVSLFRLIKRQSNLFPLLHTHLQNRL
jgi:hypothetical protein